MSNAHERRAPGTARMQFDAMVEVGGALGPSFEAQAVNLSEEGMSLRTAYLPEVGQPVMCRFDAGDGDPRLSVVAAGEVLWKDDMGDGGEFGIRFTNLDAQSTVALQRILGMAEDGQPSRMEAADPGRKVRLHIEGLASPMRARIREQVASGVTAYSELGFLRMGKPLELEDAVSGNRRPALIDRVEVEINGESLVPQLVVSLRYDDTDGRAAVAAHGADAAPAPPQHHISMEGNADMAHDDPHAAHAAHASHTNNNMMDHRSLPSGEHEAPAVEVKTEQADDETDEESNKLKSAFSRNAAKITPAIMGWAKRAKVAAALLAAKARGGGTGEDVEIPMRRTTAPAPGGGLHAAGRKVVRGSVPDGDQHFPNEPAPSSRFKITKKKAAIGASIGIALVLVFIALKKPAPAPQLASAPGDGTSNTNTPGAAGANGAKGGPVAPPADPLAAAAAAMANGGPHAGKGKAIPFTNGPVGAHPTIIKVKMDGNIDGIQGATQPTGFTIVTPNRKSMDPTNTLADKDPRIADLHVSNDQPGGAEFALTFKDGVPNYLVRAHGDTLELVLAAPSSHGEKSEAHAKKKKGKKH